jgi:hypothetical protein
MKDHKIPKGILSKKKNMLLLISKMKKIRLSLRLKNKGKKAKVTKKNKN